MSKKSRDASNLDNDRKSSENDLPLHHIEDT